MGATASLKRARPSEESESSAQMAEDGAQVVSVVRRQSTRRQVILALIYVCTNIYFPD